MKAILNILTVISFLAFGWFFLQAISIDPQSIQSADQQAAASLTMIKAGLAWLALCVILTGVAITEHLEPLVQLLPAVKTCNKCGTTSAGHASVCHQCRNRFPQTHGTPPAEPEPTPARTQNQPPVEPQAQEKSPRPSRIKLYHRERAVLVIMAILVAGCATFLGAYFLANHQDTVGKIIQTDKTARTGHFGIPNVEQIAEEANQREIAGWKVLSEYCWEIVQLQAECDLRTWELKAAGAWGSP